MISPQEIRTVTFDKIMRGYRPEDVDSFLQQVAQDMDRLVADNAEKDKKLYILAEKIEEYRKDEDNLKTALLNAQRMGENVIREAKQKAEAILREASIRADTLTRVANEQVDEQKDELVRLKAEIVRFKNDVLGMYKQHIELLSELPDDENEPVKADDSEKVDIEKVLASKSEEQQEFIGTAIVEDVKEPVKTNGIAEEGASETMEQSEVSQFPDLSELYSTKEAFSVEQKADDNKDFFNMDTQSDIVDNAVVEKNQEAEEFSANSDTEVNAFQGFKGIKFSD